MSFSAAMSACEKGCRWEIAMLGSQRLECCAHRNVSWNAASTSRFSRFLTMLFRSLWPRNLLSQMPEAQVQPNAISFGDPSAFEYFALSIMFLSADVCFPCFFLRINCPTTYFNPVSFSTDTLFRMPRNCLELAGKRRSLGRSTGATM